MRYIVDIDGTICTQQKSGEYYKAEPIVKMIEYINSLYNDNNEIIYWTARGMRSNTDHKELTERQLEQWGCLYTELWMNKPSYDVWIDDKAKNIIL